MDFYRGCICTFFFALIAVVSLLFASVLGLFGLLLPPLAVGFCYLLVDTVIVELFWWDRDRNG
jgi:hypothetical protein